MFGVGWSEMLIIGLVALVVIGPKDLPIMMQRLGRFAAQVRRMGTDFQRELNKTTGLDQITELKRSITEPLRQTSEEIAREFNQLTSEGVRPTGAVKPEDPAVESVYSSIAGAAGVADASASETAGAAKPARKPRRRKAASPAPSGGDVAEAVAADEATNVPKRRRSSRAAGTNESAAAAPAGKTRKVASKPATGRATMAKTSGSGKANGKAANGKLANGADHAAKGAETSSSSEPIVTRPGRRRRTAARPNGAAIVDGAEAATVEAPLAPAEDKT